MKAGAVGWNYERTEKGEVEEVDWAFCAMGVEGAVLLLALCWNLLIDFD